MRPYLLHIHERPLTLVAPQPQPPQIFLFGSSGQDLRGTKGEVSMRHATVSHDMVRYDMIGMTWYDVI